MAEPSAVAGRPFQFRSGDAPLHRLGAGWKLLGAAAIGALGLALDSLPSLLGLSSLVVAGYVWARLPLADLWKDTRWLLLQGAVVVVLTVALRGIGSLSAGCRTALQILLWFAPLALVLRTTRSEALVEPLRRWLPGRMGFALGATLRLVPVLSRELGELVDMQRLRGARLRGGELWRLAAWRDWLACVAFPMTVRAIEVAEAAAEAAEIRGIGAPGTARAGETPGEDS